MTTRELLKDLERRKVRLTVRDDRLRIEAPRRLLTEELRCLLNERKPELLELIRSRSQREAAAGAEAARIAAMPLDEFAAAGLILCVWSNLLGCEVLFVSDDVPDAALAGTDLQVYRTDELRKLATLRPSPRDLRRIHHVKAIFNGAVADVQPPDHRAGRREAAAHRRVA